MKFIFLLLTTTISYSAGFFGDFVPTPNRMLTFYNNHTPNMFPVFDREKRWEAQIADSVMDGEVLHLKTPERDVFSIFMEAEEESDVGVILLHTRGMHPNEEELIKPLRIHLAESNYHTLSVQMPVLAKTAKYYDYVPILVYSHPRIRSAIDFYKQQGIKKIVFIAHGCGGHMLMSYIDRYGADDIDAIIGIGMGATDTGQEVVGTYPFNKIDTPVLDIIGQYDYPSVKKHAKVRKRFLNAKSKQIKLPKAKHYHKSGPEFDNLTTEIKNWIKSH
jgi:hypothetical protein